MKRFALLFALALVLVLTVSVQAQDRVVITYAIWEPAQQPAHEQIIAEFEAANPNIHVELQVIPWANYWDKLQTTVAGGTAFDVFWMNKPNFPVYASRGALTDLSPLIAEASLDTSVYPESLLEMYTYDGEIYGIPKDFDTIALFYNKTLFDEVGVPYPDESWTWDDLYAAAQALTNADHWGYLSTTGDQIGYWNYIFANGGEVLNADSTGALIDQPAACDAIKYLYSFVSAGLSPDGATQLASDPYTQLFPGGKGAMIAGGSWIARTYAQADADIDVAPLPKSPTTGERASIIHGLANVMYSGTPHPDEAWTFLQFLGSQRAAEILAETGTVIPAYEGMQDTWVSALPDMHLQVFIDALDYSVPYPSTSQGMEWNTQIQTILGEVWSGNISIDDACTTAAEAANQALADQ